ncbi:hypothetical protein [Terrabacter sp. NPDC000476]|uniref:hypothetical protein n=1 Tax=Terrabacter sp. NPDC000476 TaxID=3154258 RepID=UPI00331758A2
MAAGGALLLLPGCGQASGPTPGSTVDAVACPGAGPVKASELARLAPCDLSGMQIVVDVGSFTEVGGAVQNRDECSSAGEGPSVVICTFASPVGTGGFVGDGPDRVYFGTEDAIARVKTHTPG